MPKERTVYSCQSCGYQSPKWLGKCPDCNQWNTFAEETFAGGKKDQAGGFFSLSSESPVPITDIRADQTSRLITGMEEFDRVLGGGFVPGSLVLIGGDPGIGKSTLILQALDHLCKKGTPVLYATGEESPEQVKMRGDRLGVTSPILVVSENSIDRIVAQVQKYKPQILVVDSIQTVYLPSLESAPGSVSQVRESAGRLLYLSKTTGITTILIGHVTKDGAIAGPRMLEHMVDSVLYFEGDPRHHYRILRTMKNRFGSTNEIGIFDMTPAGLLEVENPSTIFLPARQQAVPGSTVTASLEGIRPFLVQMEALVSSSSLVNPRRTTLGVDSGRVSILIAVLEKIIGLNLYAQDVYVSAAGGFKVTEPGADLAILAALVSSFKNKPVNPRTLLLGEVGLSGEIRTVQGIDIRLKEAEKLGFQTAILSKCKKKFDIPSKIKVLEVESVSQAIEAIF